ncbi:MAG: DUF2853 family protein [Robiginitomaculum sp.]
MIIDRKDKEEARIVREAEAKEAAKEAAEAGKIAAAEAKEAEKAAAAAAKEAEKAAAAEAKAAPAAEEAPAEEVPAAEAPAADAAPAEAPAEDKTPRHIPYLENVRKYDADANEDIVKKIVNHCGIALSNNDGKFVACSDETERNTVRDSWLVKKLGVEGDDLDAKVMAVCETMKDDRMKCRVVFYYLLAKTEGKLGDI